MTTAVACLALLGTFVHVAPLEDDGHPGHAPEAQAEQAVGSADALCRQAETLAEAKDWEKARLLWEKAAVLGSAEAQYALARMYDLGTGIPQDYAKALRWYGKAAAQGHAKAQHNLGVMYDKGQGVRQDRKTAKEWYGKACDGGLQAGCAGYRRLNEAGW